MNHPTTDSRATTQREIDELVLRIRGLVRVRRLRFESGASESELEDHSAEIGRLQWRLAQEVKRKLDEERGRAE